MRTVPALLTDDMTMTGVVLGTPGYLAPERRSAYPATVQSDLYSVGAVMVESLTGQRLGPDPAQAQQLPAPFGAVASRALAPDPRARFTSADHMLQSLRIGTPGPRPVATPPTRRVAAATTAAATTAAATTAAATTAVARQPAAGTAILSMPSPARPGGAHSRVRRWRLALAAIAALILAAALFVLLEHVWQPTGPSTPVATHHATRPRTQAVTRSSAQQVPDTESSDITAVATSLANGELPGDAALASALQATAAQPPGTAREASAEQALSLAGVLLDGGGISARQYQNVVNVLQPTGATVTTTTTTTTPAPSPQFQVPFFQGHDRGPGRGAGPGVQG
jgi:serine/threonine-protein kinase